MHGFIWEVVACVVLLGGAWFHLGGVVLFGGVYGFIQGGGMHGFIWGHAWFYSGACMVFFSFFGYNEIRSMSGRYASYWNAFLLMCSLERPTIGIVIIISNTSIVHHFKHNGSTGWCQ